MKLAFPRLLFWRCHALHMCLAAFSVSNSSLGCTTQVQLEGGDGGDQTVRLFTTLPGKILLHWGVEGGANYQGGWRLPGGEAWPEGTVKYKDRALQTPWK